MPKTETGCSPELIRQNGYKGSNIESVMKDVRCLILPGGSDISPSLYRDPQPSLVSADDLDYCAERDVSDYLLTMYCLDKDIPLLAICRGMQMLSIVSGASMIQDIGSWLNEQDVTYHDLHRNPLKNDFAAHDVSVIDQESLLYSLMKKDLLENCPSWHHQGVGSIDGTALAVTAITQTDGIEIIEAMERKDKRYIIGIQYHPEAAVRKTVDKETDVNKFMSAEEALVLFKALLEEAY
ncbi:MAG: gamma-glutamyl-gamma-aminobutyrate hydrolase family protein [Erysipelotrichaceae bacterium]|nr:gamma-glutamyl-gamma-aminobutyrate hydrolase family protein [Erysipelotrichaceae bacterium]